MADDEPAGESFRGLQLASSARTQSRQGKISEEGNAEARSALSALFWQGRGTRGGNLADTILPSKFASKFAATKSAVINIYERDKRLHPIPETLRA